MNNIAVDENNKEVKIMINTIFYPKDFILKTAEKFEDLCWVELSGDPEGCMSLSFKPKNEDMDYNNIGFEFMNHLLAAIKEVEGF